MNFPLIKKVRTFFVGIVLAILSGNIHVGAVEIRIGSDADLFFFQLKSSSIDELNRCLQQAQAILLFDNPAENNIEEIRFYNEKLKLLKLEVKNRLIEEELSSIQSSNASQEDLSQRNVQYLLNEIRQRDLVLKMIDAEMQNLLEMRDRLSNMGVRTPFTLTKRMKRIRILKRMIRKRFKHYLHIWENKYDLVRHTLAYEYAHIRQILVRINRREL